MDRTPLATPVETDASAAAAYWLSKQRMAPLSRREAVEFEAWLKAAPSHALAWADLGRLWDNFDSVRTDPRILEIREAARRRAGTAVRMRRPWLVAASLVVAVIAGGMVWWRQTPHALTFSSASVSPLGSASRAEPEPLIREASTQIGERTLLLLSDGSKVTLNTATSVRADYTGTERRLTLIKGEAFFEVAKNPVRPFVVTAGSRRVIAVGTAFNVRLQDSSVRVVLVEGKVRVTSASLPGISDGLPASTVTMTAGSALVADAQGPARVEAVDASRATSWRSGKLVFEDERLADVVSEMNRYSHETLQIADPALDNRKVSGVFEPTESQAFAKALEAYGIVRASQPDGIKIVLNAP